MKLRIYPHYALSYTINLLAAVVKGVFVNKTTFLIVQREPRAHLRTLKMSSRSNWKIIFQANTWIQTACNKRQMNIFCQMDATPAPAVK